MAEHRAVLHEAPRQEQRLAVEHVVAGEHHAPARGDHPPGQRWRRGVAAVGEHAEDAEADDEHEDRRLDPRPGHEELVAHAVASDRQRLRTPGRLHKVRAAGGPGTHEADRRALVSGAFVRPGARHERAHAEDDREGVRGAPRPPGAARPGAPPSELALARSMSSMHARSSAVRGVRPGAGRQLGHALLRRG